MNMIQTLLCVLLLNELVQASGEMHYHLLQCLRDTATGHFTPASTIVVSDSHIPRNSCFALGTSKTVISPDPSFETEKILRQLFQSEKWDLLYVHENNGYKMNRLSNKKHENYIIASFYCKQQDVLKDTSQQVSGLCKARELNSRAKFVIVSVHVRENLNQFASDLFAELWKWKILNAILVVPTSEIVNTEEPDLVPVLDIYTWFPYHPPGHCSDVRDAVLLDRWMSSDKAPGRFLYNASLFPSKIPLNFHGCQIRVSTFEYMPFVGRKKTTESDPSRVIFDEGLEIRLLKHISEKKNLSIKLLDLPADGGKWGVHLGNGTWTGVTGEIIRSYSDVATGNWWYRCHLIEEAECLMPHSIDQVRWYVPCAKPYPRWMSVTRVFKLSLWLGFLSSYVVVSISMWLIVKLSYGISTKPIENQAFTSLLKCLLNFWAIILEESASNNPPHVGVIRLVFLVWVLYCLAVNTVYQTYMTSFLIDPGLQHQISSENELLDSGMALGIPATVLSVIPGISDERYRRHDSCKDVTSCEDRMAFKGDMAFFFSKYNMEYLAAAKYVDGDGKTLVCKFDEIFCIQLGTFPVPKGSQFLETFNEIIMYLLQGGFKDQWWKEIQYAATLDLASNINLPPGEYIELTLEHLQSAFYFLVLGYILSIFAFVSELFCCRK
jgi:ionotropic kainate glutamate receptor 3/ionotropic kainate glutamate receptor 5